jgi:phage terminase small subunit
MAAGNAKDKQIAVKKAPAGGAIVPVRPDWAKDLSHTQFMFVRAYCATFNATKAYEASHPGCALSTARADGPDLLKNPLVKVAVDAAIMTTEIGSVRAGAMQLFGLVQEADPGDIFEIVNGRIVVKDISQLTRDQRRSIKKIKITKGNTNSVEVELHDPLKASELIGRATGLFKEEKQAQVAVQINIDSRDVNC